MAILSKIPEPLKPYRGTDLKTMSAVWIDTFSLDIWWRSKHNVPFGSEAHRSQTIMGMAMEWEEHLISKEKPDSLGYPYKPNSGNIYDRRRIDKKYNSQTEADIQRDFEELDIDKY